jgi:hypothetical protein
MTEGYLLTVAVESAVLCVGLSRRHRPWERLVAGAWLTACTYPVVWVALPPLFADRWVYLAVAEGFAVTVEAGLFWAAFIRPQPSGCWSTARDVAAVVGANGASFAVGELLSAAGLW